MPAGRNKVLEVGCGTGQTLLGLEKLGKAAEIVGVDIVDLKPQGLHGFICRDIEKTELPYPSEYFDVIICADVLEHLYDPWGTIRKLSMYLKTGGIFLASLPNMREIRTISLIFAAGDFKYEKEGILDKTHLRFFCRKNMIDLVMQAGLEIECILCRELSRKRKWLNFLTLGMMEGLLAHQYTIIARKNVNG